MIDLNEMGQRARTAARVLAIASTEQKNAALHLIARALRARMDAVLDANSADMQHGRALGMSAVLLDRLLLNPQRLDALAGDVERVAGLPDPVGERFEPQALPSGLRVHKRRVPFGVVGMIYEARPTVTVDAATVCLKAGNATILRGGSETQHSNMALTALLRDALAEADLPADIVQSIDSPDRALVRQLLRLDQYVDVLIPRGSASLNQFCRQHSTIPVITGGSGVCHIYVDQAADLDQALPIIANSKVVQPTACNTLETLLVHRAVAARLLPALAADLLGRGVELRVDEQAMDVLHDAGLSDERIVPAQASDFGTEFMALILAVRVVDGLDAAVEHIARYGTGHSDAVLSADPAVAEAFVRAVDSAAVLVNASLRFNDAGQLGLGAEIAISNQKLHVRGPMALRELTTYKWVLEGAGQIRP